MAVLWDVLAATGLASALAAAGVGALFAGRNERTVRKVQQEFLAGNERTVRKVQQEFLRSNERIVREVEREFAHDASLRA